MRQRRSVLTRKAFVRWSRDALIPLVVHNERLHEETEVEVDGEVVRRCALYPGLSCRDHVRAAVDVDNARGEHLVQVPFVELCPNSWLVLPDGEVQRIAEKDQFDPKAIRRQVERVQEGLGASLEADVVVPVREALERAEAALDDDRWREALEALAGIERHVPAPHAALRALVRRHFEAIDEWVAFEAEDALEREEPTDADRALLARLASAVNVLVYGRMVPIKAKLDAWLRDNPSRTGR